MDGALSADGRVATSADRSRNLVSSCQQFLSASRRLRMALLRVEQARTDSLANSCKEPLESSPQTDETEASSSPSKPLVS
jgi:hypothetical protein